MYLFINMFSVVGIVVFALLGVAWLCMVTYAWYTRHERHSNGYTRPRRV